MGTFITKMLINCWCIFCILIMFPIAFLINGGPNNSITGFLIGGIVAFLLFLSPGIVQLIKRIKQKNREFERITCPTCLTLVDKDPGICPICGNRL